MGWFGSAGCEGRRSCGWIRAYWKPGMILVFLEACHFFERVYFVVERVEGCLVG